METSTLFHFIATTPSLPQLGRLPAASSVPRGGHPPDLRLGNTQAGIKLSVIHLKPRRRSLLPLNCSLAQSQGHFSNTTAPCSMLHQVAELHQPWFSLVSVLMHGLVMTSFLLPLLYFPRGHTGWQHGPQKLKAHAGEQHQPRHPPAPSVSACPAELIRHGSGPYHPETALPQRTPHRLVACCSTF